jgi:amino acid transporter
MIDTPEALPPAQYKQELERSIGVWNAVCITVSGISPIASVFIIAPVVFDQQGSGVLLSSLLAALICLGMALCYSELGSVFPIAGGEYAIVARVLGRPLGFIAFVDYMLLALVGPSSLGLGTAQYVGVFWPGVNGHLVGVLLIITTTLIALVSIKSSAVVTALFLLLQFLAVAVIIILCFSHAHQSPSILFHPQDFSHGLGGPVSAGVIIAGIALAVTVFNGYDGPLIFSEEIQDARKNVPRAVLWSLLVAILSGVIPILAVLIGTPSLKALTTAANPMSYVLHVLGGSVIDDLVTISIILAIFNGSIVGMLTLGRIFYSSGRDKAWPGPVSGWMAYTHPRLKTPVVATAFIGAVGAIITAFTNIATVVTFAAFLLVILYGLVSVAAPREPLNAETSAPPLRDAPVAATASTGPRRMCADNHSAIAAGHSNSWRLASAWRSLLSLLPTSPKRNSLGHARGRRKLRPAHRRARQPATQALDRPAACGRLVFGLAHLRANRRCEI